VGHFGDLADAKVTKQLQSTGRSDALNFIHTLEATSNNKALSESSSSSA
jgi:hypothetical protein